MKLIITVDTEADDQWKKTNSITTKNIAFLPKFQVLCEKYGFLPTYLITYEVAENKDAVIMLKEWQSKGVAEIGAHLHPRATPPFLTANLDNSIYPFELPDKELEAKLISLTNLITENFGKKPTSYRAGRWGFDNRQAEILARLGYLVDCSITPKINWTNNIGKSKEGPDFRLYQVQPYVLSSGLLEVPMTILFTGIINTENNRLGKLFLRLPNNLMKKIINKIFFNQKWLRIFPNSKDCDWQKIYNSAIKNKLPIVEFMIHSSELMAGGSPYAKGQVEVDFIYSQLEKMFKYFKGREVEGIGLSDFAREFNN